MHIKKLKILLFAFIIVGNLFGQDTGSELKNQNDMRSNILGLRTTCYLVSNLEEAKDWYAKAFSKEPYFDEPFYVGFNIGGFELGLMPTEDSSLNKSEGVLTYWGVEDIESEFQRFVDLGAKIHEKPNNVGGDLMVASVKDPWGNIIGLIYNPYFKIDE